MRKSNTLYTVNLYFDFGQQEESNRALKWFIKIKAARDSVEVTSQVDAIKDRGIFKIGNSGKDVKNSHQLVSNNTIISILSLF